MTASKVDSIKLSNGYLMPQIGLGTFHGKERPDIAETEAAVQQALQLNYRHFDCAYDYENEAGVGNAIEKLVNNKNIGSIKREDLFIVSKLWMTFTRQDRVEICFRRSLADLKVDYIDLYYLHWPMSFKQVDDDHFPKDPKTGLVLLDESIDICDTWKGMEALVDKGLVRSLGISNFNSDQIKRLMANSRIKPVVHQFESHPYLPQTGMIELCRKNGIECVAYAPLGTPNMECEFRRVSGHGNLWKEPLISQLANKYSRSNAQILLRFQIQRGVGVVPKTCIKSEMEDNLRSFEFSLSEDEMEELASLENGWRSYPLIYAGVETHKEYPFNKKPF